MLELALVENIQRKDLTPFEESDAMQSLAQRCGYTHEDLAKRLGKSRTTITEALSLTGIPPEVRKVCRLAGLPTVRCCCRSSGKAIHRRCWRWSNGSRRKARTSRASNCARTRRSRRRGRPKHYVFAFKPENKAFNLKLSFNRKSASKEDVISALEAIIKELRQAMKSRAPAA